jgi:hypothetical protein
MGSPGALPNTMGKGKSNFHDIKLWGGRFNYLEKNKMFYRHILITITCVSDNASSEDYAI